MAWLDPKTLGKFLEALHRRTVFKSTPSFTYEKPYARRPGRSIPGERGGGRGGEGESWEVSSILRGSMMYESSVFHELVRQQATAKTVNLFKPKWITSFSHSGVCRVKGQLRASIKTSRLCWSRF